MNIKKVFCWFGFHDLGPVIENLEENFYLALFNAMLGRTKYRECRRCGERISE